MARPPKKISEKFSHIERTPMTEAACRKLQRQADRLTGGNRSALVRSRIDDPYGAELVCLINELALARQSLDKADIGSLLKTEVALDLQKLAKYGMELLSHAAKR
ncbi:hypothetical protein [Hymenobacter fodinae]|uniref:Uncharacterized protein n=1 Tax=Hymenobacter fodinae TaxID=2510796 RepID=A0A4Z0P032_9BACT|nr:hypothetical protein [Hymenobacter fodinae]TGE04614.1 hypothetical protein EU556_20735 [Hymenobacter fodinae]